MQRVDYDVPVPYEEEPEPVQNLYEATKTQEYYFPGKQIPSWSCRSYVLWKVFCLLKVHAMFYEVLFHV